MSAVWHDLLSGKGCLHSFNQTQVDTTFPSRLINRPGVAGAVLYLRSPNAPHCLTAQLFNSENTVLAGKLMSGPIKIV